MPCAVYTSGFLYHWGVILLGYLWALIVFILTALWKITVFSVEFVSDLYESYSSKRPFEDLRKERQKKVEAAQAAAHPKAPSFKGPNPNPPV
jgi:hypothetical protein